VSQADFNCDCVDSNSNETLLQLRTRLMRRLGYSAQATNPPPGMAELLDDFLRDAQDQLYMKNPVLRTERLYRWTMVPGISYYGILDNDGDTEFSDIDCGKHLNDRAYRITGVWLEDLNSMWMPMRCGINPSFYTTAAQEGLPTLYEIRSCIEVFPVPNAAYKLWVKGQMGVEPFVANTDKTTINSDLVFGWALGDAKAHYRQPDANEVKQSAREMLGDMIAGNHLTRRYVPNTYRLPPAVEPVMVDFNPPV
jgi:hypothetical protein